MFKSPYETLWNMKPTINHFHVLNYMRYVFVPSHLRSKFDKKVIHLSLLSMKARENDGGVVILPVNCAAQHEILVVFRKRRATKFKRN